MLQAVYNMAHYHNMVSGADPGYATGGFGYKMVCALAT